MERNYKYDISISFAGSDRNIALCIYLAFQLYLPKNEAYYYPEKQDEMIGKDLINILKKIYSEGSRYVILIVSKDYVDPDNKLVQTEINAYMPRFKDRKSPYLIPIVVDDTPLEKVHEALEGLTFFRWEYNPEQLVKTIREILDTVESDPEPEKKTIIYNNDVKSKNAFFNQGSGDNHFNF